MPGYKWGKKIREYNSWWKGDIPGEYEEKLKDATLIKEYTFKLLDYSDKDELPEEEVIAHKRLYQFARQGPKVWHHRFNPKTKLTSADVLYILTNNMSSARVGKLMSIDPRQIREIRHGDKREWEWEHDLVKRIKGIVRANMQSKELRTGRRLYIVTKQVDKDTNEELYYTSSKTRARRIREEMIPKKEYKRLIDEEILEIMYPIKETELL